MEPVTHNLPRLNSLALALLRAVAEHRLANVLTTRDRHELQLLSAMNLIVHSPNWRVTGAGLSALEREREIGGDDE